LQALLHRVLLHAGGELVQALHVLTQFEPQLLAIDHDIEAQAFEASTCRADELGVHPRERSPPPQRQRVVELAQRRARFARPFQLPAGGHSLVEREHIQGVPVDGQGVTDTGGVDPGPGVGAKDITES
jgi:hypothetical protein